MNVPNAIEDIRFKLGRRRDLDPEIRRKLDEQQLDLENEDNLPWFLQRTLTFTLPVVAPATAPVYPLPLPPEFIREFEDSGVFLFNTTGTPVTYPELTKTNMEKGRAAFGVATGQPCGYAIMGTNLHLFPRPDKSYILEMDCYTHDELPSVAFARDGNAATNLWLTHAPQVLIESVVLIMASELRDNNGVSGANQRLQQAWRRLQEQTIARMEQNQLRQLGEDN